MRKAVGFVAILVLAVVSAGPAHAKGLEFTGASFSGPGVAGSQSIETDQFTSKDPNVPWSNEAVAGVLGSYTRRNQPWTKHLGPRYTLTYTFKNVFEHDTDSIVEYVHPFASGGPLSYVPPGQSVMGARVKDGWLWFPDDAIETLQENGLPTSFPLTPAPSQSEGFPIEAVGLMAVVGAAAILFGAMRRRLRRIAPSIGLPR